MDGTDETPRELTDLLHDAARLAALARTGLLDSETEPSFDRLTRLVSKFLGTPVALVSLVDADRQFFQSCVGLPEPWAGRRETPLSHSFCQHVVISGKPLVIEDARLDARVKDNLAIADLGVIAYLGIPLTIDGQVIGSFCAIDGSPRQWSGDDIAMLTDLAESVITEIRLREELAEVARQRTAAEEARRRIQVTLASIGDAVIATDAGGTITYLNPVAGSLSGWSEAEAVGQPLESVFRIVNESTREPVEDPVKQVFDAGQVVGPTDHTLLISRDGRETPIEDSAAPIRTPDGKIGGVILVFRDVTERKKHEKDLIDAKIRLDHALSAGSVATFTWDIAGDRFVGDANMVRFYSIAPEHVEGGPAAEYLQAIHPDDRQRIAESIGRGVETCEPFEEEYRIGRGDGPDRWVVGRGTFALGDGGRPAVMSGVVVDVTERMMAAEQIRKGEERYRTLFEAMDEGFCVIEMINDPEGRPVDYRFLEANPAFHRQTGWHDAMGKRMRELVPDHEDHWFEIYGEVARTGRPIRFEQAARGIGDRWYEVNAVRVGRPEQQRAAVLFNDITERKRSEAERARLLDELLDADRRKDEFLAMLAHELRNPLGAISSGVMLVKTVKTPEVLDQIKDMIDRQTQHLTHLIDDLLDVSRVATGKIVLKKQTVELGHLIARAIDQVRPVVEERRHELTISRPDRAVPMVADPTRVEQILGNLLTNAAKYTPSGGLIHLDAELEGDQVVITITDDGVGISSEMLPKIFGLFTQIDSSIDRSQGGLGIGLTLVHSLVEMHGGQVTARSEGAGKGSTFTVHLPVGEPEALDLNPATAEAILPGPERHRILIVDDNRDTARMTGRLLAYRGFEVQTAFDGHEGLEAARQFRPDVVLLDIGLPGMNGYEVATALGREECCRDAVIIGVSGYGEAAAREKARLAGFHHHLTKPLDFDQLDDILRQVPGQYAGERA